ncbi:helix-turn-helix transcriptional regulator [Luteibacter sp.]|uniref:helix-turn-helix domain-containing protein n=1 Tax=Luteibacter sp. TaxID=1886636 RepID=UPI0025C4E778|nr:helix-turn-helix transcriptional regulator [Luteibacter sp.]
MQTIFELGEAVAIRRKALRMKQTEVAERAGIAPEVLSRFERGALSEFGVRKLMAVLSVLGMELEFAETGQAGSLDALRRERGGDS